jgi:Ser/Thr protein kinase RdoA (MazF antagonist)
VARVRALAGGTASAVHAVDVVDRAGTLHPLVLRRYVRGEGPEAPRREAAALEATAPLAVPTARLVAVGPDAVLMTRLEGALDWERPSLRRLAAVLPAIHAAAAPEVLPPYAPYPLTAERAPTPAFARAFAVFHGPPPSAERRFIHRDYHPGNVLWRGGAISGIVDWASASVGAPAADVGHCRVNLDPAAADRFLAAWRSVAGRDDYDPYWDVVAVLGGCTQADVDRFDAADTAFLLRAVSQL